MFKQKIKDGYQIEVPDEWLKNGNPFELKRPEYAKEVRFGGNIRTEYDEATGRTNFIQENYQSVMAVPFDYPIVGYGNHIVNTLRIWDAEAITDFQLDSFDKGEYDKAVEQKNLAKNIVEVLYPNDNHYEGKELRLKQQYFFVSASLQAAVAKYKKNHDDITKLYEKMTIQMNDTHPTVSVAELMRILMDEEGLGWDEAWEVTTKTCAYTNHTIMAEALEKWPIDLFSKLLPRVYQIVEEIDRRFVNKIREMYPGNEEKVKKMAILWDGTGTYGTYGDRSRIFCQWCCKTSYRNLKESGIKRFLSDDAREIQQQDKWNHTETFLNAWKPITCRLGNKETWNRHMGNRPFFNVRTEEICG